MALTVDARPPAPSRAVRRAAGIVAYASIFVVALPALLALWMRRLDEALRLAPSAPHPWAAIALAAAGLLLMAAGTHALWRFGGGLPMSPYPPARLVSRGVYSRLRHPIYTGAVLACAAWSVWTRSRAGLLVVTPALALAAAAFVLGYEGEATRRRCGAAYERRRGSAAARGWLVPARAAWCGLCAGAERIANSWREWRVGPVRIMNHGLYAAAGAALGVGVAAWLAGREWLWWMVALALVAQAGAAVWAQAVEGSPQLLRPYGYFGSVAAVVLACAAAGLAGADAWTPLAAFAVGACVTQAAGRLRCLVQGCCHGRPVDAAWGLRYRHPRSRVVRLGGLENVPLQPTPLYSILWTLTTGGLLTALWLHAAPLTFVAGLYLLLVGLGRFVEEHLRGEPQTLCLGGLRLYQWLAIAFVVAGAAVTGIPAAAAPAPEALPAAAVPALAGLALVTAFLFGVDFPASNRRFSRLA